MKPITLLKVYFIVQEIQYFKLLTESISNGLIHLMMFELITEINIADTI